MKLEHVTGNPHPQHHPLARLLNPHLLALLTMPTRYSLLGISDDYLLLIAKPGVPLTQPVSHGIKPLDAIGGGIQ